jgi:endonuclease YncB( thermonuclease family)
MRRPRGDVPDFVLRQLRRRTWTRRGIFTALLLVALTSVLDRARVFGYRGDDWAHFDRHQVLVTSVIDGDTVHIRVSDAIPDEKVRLLGIDAPEIAHNSGQTSAHWGPEATAYLKQRVEGKSITLRLDSTQTRDKYHRLLAYLYLNGDAENVNLSLVRDGDAYADRFHSHSMRRQFEQAEDEARGKAKGLWTDVTEAQMPAWRQRWLAERRGGRGPNR